MTDHLSGYLDDAVMASLYFGPNTGEPPPPGKPRSPHPPPALSIMAKEYWITMLRTVVRSTTSLQVLDYLQFGALAGDVSVSTLYVHLFSTVT